MQKRVNRKEPNDTKMNKNAKKELKSTQTPCKKGKNALTCQL